MSVSFPGQSEAVARSAPDDIKRQNAVWPSFLSAGRSILRLGEFIRFSHTIFALPFALIAMLVAGGGEVQMRTLGWILVCMVSARTLAMCFNRIVDWEMDKLNPRTASRHRLVPKPVAWGICASSLMLLVLGTRELNSLCFRLSPVMILLITLYSFTKRFTSFSHFFLGLALSVAPLAAWAAVRAELASIQPYLLSAAVLLWVFGFDLIYATLDAEFDRRRSLFSFPACYGIPATLRLARILHIGAAGGLFVFGWSASLGFYFWIAWAIVLVAFYWEHRLADPKDPASVNTAFFRVNAFVSICLLIGVIFDFYVLT